MQLHCYGLVPFFMCANEILARIYRYDGAGQDGSGQFQVINTSCRSRKDGEICDMVEGHVCRNGSCVSACQREGMQSCKCKHEDDAYCFLCCGSSTRQCLPAHSYKIYRPNGERWERDSCRFCHSYREGLPCDDKDQQRLCKAGKCSRDICEGKPEGAYCDKRMTKVCVNNECVNPCGKYLVCDCDEEETSLELSQDRCQLCCYNFQSRQCESAYKKYRTTNRDGRPIARTGLSCSRGRSCDRYGVCSAKSLHFCLPLLLSAAVFTQLSQINGLLAR